MITVGVTGGIGSGKTSALKYFVNSGSCMISADYIAHIVLDKPAVINQLVARYGDIKNSCKKIDRKKLGAIIFDKKEEVEFVNSITHPLIKERLERDIKHHKDSKTEVLIVEIPLLFECNLQYLVDKIIVVDAPIDVRIQRVVERDKITAEQALERINNQMSSEEKCNLADFVIVNDGNLENLKAQCLEVWRKI